LGTSLSGGLDSSSITAVINSLSAQSGYQKTFSAIFPGYEKDESSYINLVAKKFNIKNYTVIPSAQDLIGNFEKLCWHHDEPFMSSSVYTQYKVFELAKQQGVTVLLDGQGADEMLAGYHKYIHWYLQDLLTHSYTGERKKVMNDLKKNEVSFNWGLKNYAAAFLPIHTAMYLERKEYKQVMNQPDLNTDFLHQNIKGRQWDGIHKTPVTKLNDILHYNTIEFGLEELLRYADRNSMAHGREVRLPFLSHTLAEFVFSLPASLKINEGFTKWLLRNAMNKRLPDEIVWRKDKVGFEPPQKQWMEMPIFQDYLHEAKKKLVNKGVLNTKTLSKKTIVKEADAADIYGWRYLCAAQFY
jgi:asparagine synthase (glutamine-hydrolysing)